MPRVLVSSQLLALLASNDSPDGVELADLLAGREECVSAIAQVDNAIAILQRRGLEPDIENVNSDKVPRDEVISQNPDAGAEVREGGSVEIRVSLGKERVAVPDVTGRSRCQARSARAPRTPSAISITTLSPQRASTAQAAGGRVSVNGTASRRTAAK